MSKTDTEYQARVRALGLSEIRCEQITAYDVRLTGFEPTLGAFIRRLRKAGLRCWKLGTGHYQVSFEGHPELRERLDRSVGDTWHVYHPVAERASEGA